MAVLSGKLLTDSGFIDGHVELEGGIVKRVGEGLMKDADAHGTIVPTFVNAHTHIADYVVPLDTRLSLEELVAPPHGLKHRTLACTPRAELTASMRSLSLYMMDRGTSRFIDFREGGVEGAKALADASGAGAVPTVMARPCSMSFDEDEVGELLQVADGIAVSSISDWDYGELSALASFVNDQGKPFAIHASERVREDIGKVLDLHPRFIVHMTAAADEDLRACAEAGVPVAVCPRSNLFFGLVPPLRRMLDAGVRVALGTDNAMVSMPDMFQEVEAAARLLRAQGVSDLGCLADMAFRHPRILLNRNDSINIRPGGPCELMVLRSKGGDPLTDLALRSSTDDPAVVCIGRETRRRTR